MHYLGLTTSSMIYSEQSTVSNPHRLLRSYSIMVITSSTIFTHANQVLSTNMRNDKLIYLRRRDEVWSPSLDHRNCRVTHVAQEISIVNTLHKVEQNVAPFLCYLLRQFARCSASGSDTPKHHLEQLSLSLLNKVCTARRADPDSFHNLSKYLKEQNGILHEDFRCTLLRRRASGKPHDKAFWSLLLGRKAVVGGPKASSG
ncbi:hypothetical protein ARMSODRAFT_382220 [Armillaria solidipes]|uniref:Uncharacterized protein n=1 Tax=Armillaria solidipes TaxID=1076256 RepID=A0A2H3B4X3_9AGAR|nr:hypothetical protein ARMSODRAFT_382220 [Armillaria solidipes]